MEQSGKGVNSNIIKLYHNKGEGKKPWPVMIDRKYIAGWVIDSNNREQWIVIYTSFGKEFHMDKIKESELCHEEFKWNMEQLIEGK